MATSMESGPAEDKIAPRLTMERTGSIGSVSSAGSADSPRRRRTSITGGPAAPSYSLDLFQAFPQVCQKAKSGVQLCHAVASVLAERAATEQQYAQSLLKTAQHAGAEDWATHLTSSWANTLLQMEQLAKERAAFAATLHTSVVPGVKAFATQHESQVQRLITEGKKVRSAHQQMLAATDKAKEKYDRRCAEAAEIASALRKLDPADATATGSSPPPSVSRFALSAPSATANDDASSSSASGTAAASGSGSASALTGFPLDDGASKERSDKLSAGPGQLLTKMWDTTSAFGRSPLERQRSKLDGCLDDVLGSEKNYVQAVEVMNAQRPIFEREIKENLHAFQLTEEQRLEYLKDVLVRTEKAFAKIFPRAKEIVEQMRASAQGIDELADIERAFQQLGPQLEVDVDGSDLANNPFYNRVIHIQALSDAGHRMIGVISGAIMEFTVTEDRHVQQLRKLLRIHEHGNNGNGGISTAADLFGSSSSLSTSPSSSSPLSLSNHPGAKFVHAEGSSMAMGWLTLKDEVQLLLEVHQEFRSLLSEPVALSLETMKLEYETTSAAAQENFVKVHSSLCFESSSHQKLRQKFYAKLREFASLHSSVHDEKSTEDRITCLADAERVLAAYQTQPRGPSVSERERRTEQKLWQLLDEMKILDEQLSNSLVALKDKFHLYVQDIEIFVSTYMKNEKFRLQVAKSSLQSFAKALRHMISGNSSLAAQSLEAFERIDVTADISAFIEANRKPYQRSKRVVPAYHTDEALRDALRAYQHIPEIQSPSKGDGPDSAHHSQALRPARPTDSASPGRRKLDGDGGAETGNGKSDDPAAAANDQDPSDESMDSEDYPGLEDEGEEVQPLGMSDFQKKFKLSSPEQVVESYSCALYLSNFPYHGRLYLTRDHMCFTGWRDTIFVASFSDIASMEKKNTALIVPNAIELMVNGERVFFASFVFRDECFQCIQQLRAIKIGTDAILSGKAPHETSSSKSSAPGTEPSKSTREGGDASANKVDESVIGSPSKLTSESMPTMDNGGKKPPGSDESAVVVPPADAILNEFEMVMNEEVPFSVEDAYSTLWIGSNTFALELLSAAGSTNVQLGDWAVEPVTYAAVDTPDEFEASRAVSYTHNKKYMVGPSTIPTTQLQRYRYSKRSRLVVSVTTTISNVPYCDYFRVEHRWVFSATEKSSGAAMCLAQVGIRVQFLKSTWIKKQIESTTVSESKDAIRAWIDAAIGTLEKQKITSTQSSAAEVVADEVAPLISTETPPVDRGISGAKPSATVATTIAVPDDSGGVSPSFRSALQLLSLLCALLFLYALLRVCVALEQMQALTREMLQQQQQQQVLFREMMARLDEINNK